MIILIMMIMITCIRVAILDSVIIIRPGVRRGDGMVVIILLIGIHGGGQRILITDTIHTIHTGTHITIMDIIQLPMDMVITHGPTQHVIPDINGVEIPAEIMAQ
jgi:hypothetical protein